MSSKGGQQNDAPALVFVHGAWLDGSSWREVIALLQRKGFAVSAAQAPLTSFEDDTSTVLRVLERQNNAVVLIGHGYGGGVISQAGVHTRVKGLVYVSAVVPDVGESAWDLWRALPNSGYAALPEPDARGFVHLMPQSFADCFAHDLPNTESRVLSATQIPIHERALNTRLTDAAWRCKPTCYLITAKDRMIHPAAQEHFIRRTGAAAASIASGHVPFLSRPAETTDRIIEALKVIQARYPRPQTL